MAVISSSAFVAARRRRDLSQEAAAELCDLSVQTIRRLERARQGRYVCRAATLAKLAKCFPGVFVDLDAVRLSLRETAARLGMSARTLGRRVESAPDRVPPPLPGDRLVFAAHVVREWIARRPNREAS